LKLLNSLGIAGNQQVLSDFPSMHNAVKNYPKNSEVIFWEGKSKPK
jgi:hypothetical protein